MSADWRRKYIGVGLTLEVMLLRHKYVLALRLWPLNFKIYFGLHWPGPFVRIGPLELSLDREED